VQQSALTGEDSYWIFGSVNARRPSATGSRSSSRRRQRTWATWVTRPRRP